MAAADIVFLIDATGSMGPCIKGLKESLSIFFDKLASGELIKKPIDWRAKIVGFRDYKHDGAEKWLVDNPFSTNVDELKLQLSNLVARGGGDEPEDLLDALLTVTGMEETGAQEEPSPTKWRERHIAKKMIVVFTDATHHPTVSVPPYEGATVDDVVTILQSKKVIITLVLPTLQATEKMATAEQLEACYSALSSTDKAEVIVLRDDTNQAAPKPLSFKDIPEHMDLFENFLAQLAKSVSASAAAPTVETL